MGNAKVESENTCHRDKCQKMYHFLWYTFKEDGQTEQEKRETTNVVVFGLSCKELIKFMCESRVW